MEVTFKEFCRIGRKWSGQNYRQHFLRIGFSVFHRMYDFFFFYPKDGTVNSGMLKATFCTGSNI